MVVYDRQYHQFIYLKIACHAFQFAFYLRWGATM